MRRLAAGVLLVVSLLSWAPPYASGDGLVNSETFSGFQFNFNNPGAPALGMGGAFVAVADDATAVVANPAGLVILQRPEISAEAKFTRYRNTINAFTNTPAEGSINRVHSREFEDDVLTPSFFSFVYPTERLVVALFARELVNYESQFHTEGTFFTAPNGDFFRLFPVRSELEITALTFGLGAGINLEKQHPLLPNISGPASSSRSVAFAPASSASISTRSSESRRHYGAPRSWTAPISVWGSTWARSGGRSRIWPWGPSIAGVPVST